MFDSLQLFFSESLHPIWIANVIYDVQQIAVFRLQEFCCDTTINTIPMHYYLTESECKQLLLNWFQLLESVQKEWL